MQPPLLEKPSEVWQFLLDHGGLDLKRYDHGFEDEVREHLHLPQGELGSVADRHGIRVEVFIVAFLKAAAPYGAMFAELLAMFEQAGATVGDHAMNVDFDFARDREKLCFDLEHFRRWLEQWREVMQWAQERVWTYQQLWDLARPMHSRANRMQEAVRDSAACAWAGEYDDGRWPSAPLPPPVTRIEPLDEVIEEAWDVWTAVVEASARLSPDRATLHARGWEASSQRAEGGRDVDGPREDDADDPFPVWLLGPLDHDRWARSFALSAYAAAERIGGTSQAGFTGEAEEWRAELEAALAAPGTRRVRRLELVRVLFDFLQLPLWQQRHELYSAWVCTRLVEVLREFGVRVHHEDGVFRLAFSGTHVATCDGVRPAAHLWAEVRSPLDDPVGDGRTDNIQPDYRIRVEPLTGERTDVLVVECKQYLRASRRKFADALTDYASGCPAAQVVLVNHHAARDDIVDDVPATLKLRVHVVGNFRPGSADALRRFDEIARQALLARCTPANLPTSPKVDTPEAALLPLTGLGRVTLTWGAQPKDLDLTVRITTTAMERKIYFSNHGSISSEPWAEYDHDVLTGFGPETVTIHRWMDAAYDILVHNYSGDSSLAGSGARVDLELGGRRITFVCPATGSGSWWRVCTVDGQSGVMAVHGEIVADVPPPALR